jgi:membrane-associated phospholipid phosphatase
MQNILYGIGNLGPYGLIILSIYLLRNKDILLFCYIFGTAANIVMNFILKNIFQHPRPKALKSSGVTSEVHDDNSPSIVQQIRDLDIYGMPSGHSQSAAFSTMFIYLALKQMNLLLLYLIITGITLWQRVHYNFHTIMQVAVGVAVGLGIAYCTFLVSQKILVGDLSTKEDDNALLVLSSHDTR